MNGYPFAGPGGQKTLHRQAAVRQPAALSTPEAEFVALVNVFSPCLTPSQVYAGVMEFDNR